MGLKGRICLKVFYDIPELEEFSYVEAPAGRLA